MRKTQQEMIDKAKRGGFKYAFIDVLEKEDLTIKQLQEIFRFASYNNYWLHHHGEDFSHFLHDFVRAVEEKDQEELRRIYTLIDEQIPKDNIADEYERYKYEEICKIKEPSSDEGVLLVDLAVWFPYTNKEVVKLDFGLMSIKDEFKNEEVQKTSVLNRRFSNKGYLTLSAKNGRKVCGIGYPVILPRKRLNEFLFLEFEVGTKKDNMQFAVPILLNLTKEKPCTSISIHANIFDDKSFPLGIKIRHRSCDSGGKCASIHYSTTEDSAYTESLYAHEMVLPDMKRRAVLTPSEDPLAAYEEGAIFVLAPTTYERIYSL